MRFEVPQFIEVEDKLFGPLTWKQFVYLVGGAGAAFICYATLPFGVFIIAATPILALSMALAFYKVNNRPFANLLEAGFMYLTRSRLYLWNREERAPEPRPQGETEEPQQTYLPPSQSTLASLSRQLEIHRIKRAQPK